MKKILNLICFNLCILFCSLSFARADLVSELKAAVGTSEADQVEQIFATLDTSTHKDDALLDAVALFATTHPNYVSLLKAWEEKHPDSIYRKTALSRHLSHLGWIARGTEPIYMTHHSSVKLMKDYLEFSANLAWEVFFERPDFLPASLLVAEHYLNDFGMWPVKRFASVALEESPNYLLLDSLVLSQNPKWGGSWDAVKRMCDTYGDTVDAPDWYNPETCFVAAIYDNPKVLFGHEPELLKWAQDVLDAAEPDAMIQQRRIDFFTLERHVPQMKAEAIRLFSPLSINASRRADYIEQVLGVEGFADQQRSKIQRAWQRTFEHDPHNPKSLGFISLATAPQNKYQSFAMSEQEALNAIEGMKPYAHYRPEIWHAIAQIKFSYEMSPFDFELLTPYFEQAVATSLYQSKYIDDYYHKTQFIRQQMKKNIRKETVEHNGKQYDVFQTVGQLDCTAVRVARLIDFSCNSAMSIDLNCSQSTMVEVSKFLTKANRFKYCPKVSDAEIIDIAMDAKEIID